VGEQKHLEELEGVMIMEWKGIRMEDTAFWEGIGFKKARVLNFGAWKYESMWNMRGIWCT
jgi:hypothetical protein